MRLYPEKLYNKNVDLQHVVKKSNNSQHKKIA